jgi:hypothetical protein
VVFESIRLLILLLYEFAYDHLIILMVVFLVETLLRAIICANFVAKALVILKKGERTVKLFQYAYYSVVGIVILVILGLALFSTNIISCNYELYSYHWFILDGLDLL